MKDKLKPAQLKASNQLVKKLERYGIACLWGEARSGKTRAFLNATRGYETLVITEKSAISGVLSEAKELDLEVDVINYQSVHKMNPNDYKLIVLDESHRFISQSQPKPSTTWKNVVQFTKNKFIILASATPTSEGYGGLYYQLGLSSWSPFKYKRFTQFFADYGIPSTTYTGTRQVPCYKKTKGSKIKAKMEHLVVKLTRANTGHEFESKDVLHVVSMTKQQKKLTKVLKESNVFEKKKLTILTDTPVKMMGKLHQISGGVGVKAEPKGVLKINFEAKPTNGMTESELIAYERSKYVWHEQIHTFKKEPPKVKYIEENFDVNNTIILSYYKHEQEFLAKLFPHTGSVTKLSTGVDLSHYESMVIYSMSFSSANYFQVKARLMNVNRKTQMSVHYLLSGIDEYVLKAVQSKENFTNGWFKKNAK